MTNACPFSQLSAEYVFGPDSVTWKTGSDPSLIVAAGAAAILQMLHPDVVRVIEKSGRYYQNPQARAERTGLFERSIIYGDKEVVKAASASFQRLHQSLDATDPVTGKSYTASEPRLLLWVHNSLTWTILKAFQNYGPALTSAEEDQYLLEQHKAAVLIGLTVDLLPNNKKELDVYMEEMNAQLALTKDSIHFRDFFVYSKGFPFTPTRIIEYMFLQASLRLMTPFQRELYAIKTSRLGDVIIKFFIKNLLRFIRYKYPVGTSIPKTLEELKIHSFGISRKMQVVKPPL